MHQSSKLKILNINTIQRKRSSSITGC